MRTLKTALATAIAIGIAGIFDLYAPVLAGISAIVSMTSSVFDSYMVSFNRMISTVLGALIASFFHYIGHTGIVTLAIGIVIIINICNHFRWTKSITLACVVFIVIMLYKPTAEGAQVTYFRYGLHRILDTFVGLIVGFTINYLIFPPDRAVFLLKTYKNTLTEFERGFRTLFVPGTDLKTNLLIDDINGINSELKSIKNDVKLLDRHNFKISDITRINSQFFHAFGLLLQLKERGHIPTLSEENLERVFDYFGDSVPIVIDETDPEFETAFNYYLDDLIHIMRNLRDDVAKFEELIK